MGKNYPWKFFFVILGSFLASNILINLYFKDLNWIIQNYIIKGIIVIFIFSIVKVYCLNNSNKTLRSLLEEQRGIIEKYNVNSSIKNNYLKDNFITIKSLNLTINNKFKIITQLIKNLELNIDSVEVYNKEGILIFLSDKDNIEVNIFLYKDIKISCDSLENIIKYKEEICKYTDSEEYNEER